MVITTKCKELLAATLNGVSYTRPSYVAYGDDNTTPLVSDTTLGNELERNGTTDSNLTGAVISISSVLTTTELIGSTISEVGLLNESSSGDLFIHEVFGDLEKTSSFEVDTTFFITID